MCSRSFRFCCWRISTVSMVFLPPLSNYPAAAPLRHALQLADRIEDGRVVAIKALAYPVASTTAVHVDEVDGLVPGSHYVPDPGGAEYVSGGYAVLQGR